MRVKNIMPISEARKRIFELAEKVQKPDTHFFLTSKGKAKVVLMSAEEFESWQETMDIMSDPGLMKEINQTTEDFKEGRMDKFITWEDMQKQLGWKLADKPKYRYVSSRPQKRGAKKSGKNR